MVASVYTRLIFAENPIMHKVTGIILAGGKSSRFGSNKALAVLHGKTLISYSLEALHPLCEQMVVSASDPDFARLGFPVIPDNFAQAGPLSGLEACMKAFPSEKYLVTGCDTPLAGTLIFQQLLEALGDHDAAVMSTTDGRAEPLIACYSNRVYPWILKLLTEGQYKASELLQHIDCKYLLPENQDSLHNINTLADMEKQVQKYPFPRPKAPKLLMITGTGRDCGKTWLGCEIIRIAAKKVAVTALKVSPHFHPLNEGMKILIENEFFILSQETTMSEKDSGRFLQAGAQTSLYLQLRPGFEALAYQAIKPLLNDHFVVCESGGLFKAVEPELLILVKRGEIPANKKHILTYSPLIVESPDGRPAASAMWIEDWLKEV